MQVVALGLGLMALLMLTLVRTDLLSSWRASLPRSFFRFLAILANRRSRRFASLGRSESEEVLCPGRVHEEQRVALGTCKQTDSRNLGHN